MNFPYQLLRRQLDKADINLLMKIKVFMFDCDGVLWRGKTPIAGAIETVNYLKEHGKSTNSSARSRAEVLQTLKGFGVESSLNEIITSSYATACYLKEKQNFKDAYIVGEKGIYDELEGIGIHCHGMEDNTQTDIACLKNMDPKIGTVVVGLDKNVNYVKLSRAAAYIRDYHCPFIATNNDPSDPNDQGLIVGAAGSMVSAVSAICGKQPDVILGKPNRAFVDIVRNQHPELDSWDIMMIGDRLETDIALAKQNGLKSVSVLTGITKKEDVMNCKDEAAPLFYIDSVAGIKDIFVFAEDMTNEDEEKQALEELERMKQEKKELRRKQREERRRKKEERDKEIAEGKQLLQEELQKMEKEERKKGNIPPEEQPKEVKEEGASEEIKKAEDIVNKMR